MKSADTSKYKTSVLAFINALLHGFDDLRERCRIREQLLAGELLCTDIVVVIIVYLLMQYVMVMQSTVARAWIKF